MDRPGAKYTLTAMSFLVLVCWLSIRVYDSMIGRIYYGPLHGFLASTFRLSGRDDDQAFRTRVAVFLSNSTSNNVNAEKYGALVVAWRRILGNQRIANEVLDSRGLLSGGLERFNVLVLPMASHLSEAEVAAIKDFAAQKGHGLIFSGTAGSYRENGEWREISLAAQILGADIAPVSASGAQPAQLVLHGRSPLSANIPPGLRLKVNTYDQPVAARLLEDRSEAAGFWEVQGRDRWEVSEARAGMVSGGYRGGRFVWTGFSLGSAVDPFGVKAGEILARNMVSYASFSPIFAKEAWPEGKRAAVIFSVEGKDGLHDAAAIAALFTRKRVPCTVFCDPGEAVSSAARLKSIRADSSFEIGMRGFPMKGRPPASLKEALVRGKKALDAGASKPVRGYAPAGPFPDDKAFRLLLDAGFRYVTDASGWGPPTPLEARRPLLSVGRKIDLLISFPLPVSPKEKDALERMMSEFDFTYRIGGVYSVSVPAGFARSKAGLAVLGGFLDYVKEKDVWLTTFGDASDWTSRWILIDADSSRTSEVRTSLVVTNNSPGTVESLRLNVHLSGGGGRITASSEQMGGRIAVLSQEKEKALIEVRRLGGAGQVFFIDRDVRR